jgi:hypothetical protein
MEERRGARVATTFLVAIEDIEQVPKQRQGDISQTGVYFETSDEVGAPGTIHWLQLVSIDQVRQVRVMACVVRSAARGRLRGAAFEFMPESDDAVASLQSFVKYSLGLRSMPGLEPHIAPRLEASASGQEAAAAQHQAIVGKLSVRSMVLETSWAVEPGELLRVDIAAPGMTRRIRLEGKAIRVAPNDPNGANPSSYTIEVEVHEESQRPLAHSSMSFAKVTPPESAKAPPAAEKPPTEDDIADEGLRTLDDLLSSLIAPPANDDARHKRVHHLAGQIASVPLTTLVSLFEMERMTGELVVQHDIEVAQVYIDGGRIIDISPVAKGETARDRIKALLRWTEGSFQFDVRAVRRADRIGASTTALLLDLAREGDEAERDANA